MAEQAQQQQGHQPEVQHLVCQQGASVPQHQQVAEAGLEAHLQQQQHQSALVAVQQLERQRLRLLQDLVENPPQ